jgi:LPS sulfotransferase NodH
MNPPARPLFLVGNPRTGSTLLTTLLLQHPDIHMHGELFHPEENERRGTHALRGRPKAWFDPRSDDAIAFLDEHVFGVTTDYRGRPVQVVGLKVFADHVATGGAADLFSRVRAHYPTAHVLHMRRDDYLAVLLSLEFAQRSRQWVAWSHLQEPRRELAPFTVPRDRARAFFEDMHRADAYFALHFAGPGYLPVHYEDLVDDLPATMAAVFAALGVAPRDVSAVTEKQVGDADLDLVENLDELRDEFAAFVLRHDIRPRERSAPVEEPEPPAPAVNVPAFTLRQAARGFGPAQIAQLLQARGAEVPVDEVDRLVAQARADTPAWLARRLDPHWAAVLAVGVPVTITAVEGEEVSAEPVMCIGILPDGRQQVLGVWPSTVEIDLGTRGLVWTPLLLAEDDDVALHILEAGVTADVIDTETLAEVRAALADVPREELRARAAGVAESRRNDPRLADLPEELRHVVIAPLHLRNLLGPYRALGRARSPYPSLDAAVDSLALLARSSDPDGTGEARWPPWRPRHTAAFAEEIGPAAANESGG